MGPWKAVAACAVAGHFVPSTVALGRWTPWRSLPGDLCRWRGPDTDAVALTFDDGPDPGSTPAVLDRLDQLGLRATFFQTGRSVERWPHLAGEVVRRGHEVGSHGYEHRHHLLRTPWWVRSDLAAAERAMTAVGTLPRWYRPSYGQVTAATLLTARRLGWQTVLWSAWGREWATDDARQVTARIERHLRPGAIVLLHDSDACGPPGMWKVALEALGPLSAALESRGLVAVTLTELLGENRLRAGRAGAENEVVG